MHLSRLDQNQNQSYIGMLQSILGTATISQTRALQYGLQAWSVVALYQGVPGKGLVRVH